MTDHDYTLAELRTATYALYEARNDRADLIIEAVEAGIPKNAIAEAASTTAVEIDELMNRYKNGQHP